MSGEIRNRLLQLICERAFRIGQFTLSSGETSDYYIDGRMVEMHPEGAALIGQAVYDRIKELEADAIGGLAVGAVPIVASTLVICHQNGLHIDGFWVRQEVKGHGTKKLIEGSLPEDAKVIIVDDVVTSGASIEKAIRPVEQQGGKIVKVITLVDRGRGARKKLEHYDYEPIFTKDELFQYAQGIPNIARLS